MQRRPTCTVALPCSRGVLDGVGAIPSARQGDKVVLQIKETYVQSLLAMHTLNKLETEYYSSFFTRYVIEFKRGSKLAVVPGRIDSVLVAKCRLFTPSHHLWILVILWQVNSLWAKTPANLHAEPLISSNASMRTDRRGGPVWTMLSERE